MLPVEDRPERRRLLFPVVMLVLLLANIVVFVYELSLSPMALNTFIETYGATPARIAGGGTITPSSAWPVFLTIFTAMFIHGSLLHIGGNMIFLWVFGDNVESAFGHFPFLLFYFFSGLAAFLLEAVVSPQTTVPSIGASGAIAGVLAAYLLLFPRASVRVLLFLGPFFALGRIAALPLIGFWFVLQLFQGVGSLGPSAADTGGVAYFAHVGGFLFGVLATIGLLVIRHQAVGRLLPYIWWDRVLRNWLIVVGALLIVVAVAGLIGGQTGRMLQVGIVIIAALFALVDGLLRATGHRGFLGEGRGAGRVLAVIQVLAALGVLVGALTV